MGAPLSQAPPVDGSLVGDEIAHFKSIPWCAKHLSSSSDLIIAPVFSRQPKPHYDDALFSVTLKTRDTIPGFICFYPGPEDRKAYLPRLQAFVSLGNMIAGYGGVSHGGILATIFDEALSLLAPGARWQGWKQEGIATVVTAYLTTRYLKRVEIPGTYLVTVWLAKKEGRKINVEGRMEDEHGVAVASAEALFVEIKERL